MKFFGDQYVLSALIFDKKLVGCGLYPAMVSYNAIVSID